MFNTLIYYKCAHCSFAHSRVNYKCSNSTVFLRCWCCLSCLIIFVWAFSLWSYMHIIIIIMLSAVRQLLFGPKPVSQFTLLMTMMMCGMRSNKIYVRLRLIWDEKKYLYLPLLLPICTLFSSRAKTHALLQLNNETSRNNVHRFASGTHSSINRSHSCVVCLFVF